jgi:predicted transcriptional regulator
MISFKTFTEEFDLIEVLTDEDIDEAIMESINIPTDIAVKIPGVKGMLYKKAIRYYLDWRKKNPKQGAAGIAKVARQLGVDTHELQKVLHKLIKKGKLPSHLATNPNMFKGGKTPSAKAGFLQR